MKKSWGKPTTRRLAITRNYLQEIGMKTIIISTILSLCVTSGLVFYLDTGRVKMNTLTLKQNGATVTVRPGVVVIKPQ